MPWFTLATDLAGLTAAREGRRLRVTTAEGTKLTLASSVYTCGWGILHVPGAPFPGLFCLSTGKDHRIVWVGSNSIKG